MIDIYDLYSPEEIQELAFDSVVPAHCTSCGEYITDAEPDAYWTGGENGNIECFKCGGGTKIASIVELLLFG